MDFFLLLDDDFRLDDPFDEDIFDEDILLLAPSVVVGSDDGYLDDYRLDDTFDEVIFDEVI